MADFELNSDDEGLRFEEPGGSYQKKYDLIQDKTYQFALRCVKLTQYLQKDSRFSKNPIEKSLLRNPEFVLSKQILRSGTAIAAILREAKYAQSKADYISKFSMSLKEASETEYWLDLLKDANYIEERIHISMKADVEEIIKLLIASLNKLKS